MRIINVYNEVKSAKALTKTEAAKTRQHMTETLGHAVDINHRDHEKTRQYTTETVGRGVDLLGRKIDTTGDALGAKIDAAGVALGAKIDAAGGWTGKTTSWIIFELLVATALFALGTWFFGTHCLVPLFDAVGTMVDRIRDWHTWVITGGVPSVWLIVAHWLIPAGRKQSK